MMVTWCAGGSAESGRTPRGPSPALGVCRQAHPDGLNQTVDLYSHACNIISRSCIICIMTEPKGAPVALT